MKTISIFILASLLLFFGCESIEKEKSEWTILVYMAADNGVNQSAINDIIQMEKAQISNDVKVVVQIDFNENESSLTGYDGASRYLVTSNPEAGINSKILMKLGDINSGEPESLVEFVNWGLSEYPSERKALILWSHATGWRNGDRYFGIDSGETISVSGGELHSSFSQFNDQFDILIFDACHMQSIEVIGEVENFASNIIASEDAISTMGFPYNDILNHWQPELSTSEICSLITNDFFYSYFPGGSQNPQGITYNISISHFDANKYHNLYEQIEFFGEKWAEYEDFSIFLEARQNCYEFNDMEMDIDMLNFFEELKCLAVEDSTLFYDCNTMIELIDNVCPNYDYFNYPDILGTFTFWFPENIDEFEDAFSLYQGLNYSDNKFVDLIKEIISQ